MLCTDPELRVADLAILRIHPARDLHGAQPGNIEVQGFRGIARDQANRNIRRFTVITDPTPKRAVGIVKFSALSPSAARVEGRGRAA